MTDVGKSLFCRVTATNASGSASADSNTVGPVTAAAAYTGPGDVISGAAGWWGLRAYSAATRGTNCVRLVRASDSAQQDFVTLSSGALDVASITTFLASTTGKVVTLYDQSGNARHATQATDANRPTFTLGAKGALPALLGNGSSTGLRTASFALTRSISQPLTASAILNRTGAFTTYGMWFASGDAVGKIGFTDTANKMLMYVGSAGPFATVADAAWHAVQGVINGASSELYIDGTTAATGDPGSAAFAGGVTLMMDGDDTTWITGYLGEAGVWPIAFDATQKTNMDANQTAYWSL